MLLAAAMSMFPVAGGGVTGTFAVITMALLATSTMLLEATMSMLPVDGGGPEDTFAARTMALLAIPTISLDAAISTLPALGGGVETAAAMTTAFAAAALIFRAELIAILPEPGSVLAVNCVSIPILPDPVCVPEPALVAMARSSILPHISCVELSALIAVE